MLPYWLMFGAAALGALFYGEPRRGHMPVMLIIAAVVLSLLIGLRFHVGGDWASYASLYRDVSRLNLFDALALARSDPAYSLLNWLAVRLGAGLWLIDLVCGALLMWGVSALAIRQPNPWLVFVVAMPYLIIVVGMGYTRQAAAIGFVLLSINAMVDHKLGKFMLFMILAALFHKSAMIMLPIVGAAFSRNRTLTIAMFVLLGGLLYVFLLSSRLDFLSRNYLREGLRSTGAPQRVAVNAAPALIFLLFRRRFGFDELEQAIWRNIAIASLVALAALLFLKSTTTIDRLTLFLIGIQLVILGRVPWALGGTGAGRAVLLILVIAACGANLFIWLNYATNAVFWLPYRVYAL